MDSDGVINNVDLNDKKLSVSVTTAGTNKAEEQ